MVAVLLYNREHFNLYIIVYAYKLLFTYWCKCATYRTKKKTPINLSLGHSHIVILIMTLKR